MATEEVEFQASDLIGPAGVGSNGEKLVQMLLIHYPPELRAALEKRVNQPLDEDLDREKIAKLVGVKRIEHAHVRGGEQRESDAMVTYVFLDSKDTVWKGAFPYSDMSNGSLDSKTHVSQKAMVADSHLAAQYKAENPRPAAEQHADPFAIAEMTAAELIDLMDEHPERAELIKTFEKAAHGKDARKTVLEHEPPKSGDE